MTLISRARAQESTLAPVHMQRCVQGVRMRACLGQWAETQSFPQKVLCTPTISDHRQICAVVQCA